MTIKTKISEKNINLPSNGINEYTGTSAKCRELEELLLKLDLMEKECVQEKLLEEKEALKDEFIALKRTMYKLLLETKELIRSRYHLQLSKGQTIEVIRKGALITQQLETLDNDFETMKDIFKKQLKQRGKKFSEDLLDVRFQEMQIIKQQIEESRSLFRDAAGHGYSDSKTLTEFKLQARDLGEVLPQDWREPTAEEQATIDRWKAKDQDIDQQVAEIGDAIDRLGELAVQIGHKADKQSQLVQSLHQQADETNKEILLINNKLKSLISAHGGINFCCKLMLTVILLGLMGFIVSLVNKRILG